MEESQVLKASVRRELALEPKTRRRRRSRLLGVSALAALLWGLGAGTAAAQPPYQQELIPGLSGFFVGSRPSPALADLDGDGDLDVAVGQFDGSVDYLENTGSSSAPIFVERPGNANPLAGVEVGFDSSPALVDLDGDGDLDVVVGERIGTLRYFENTGSSNAPVFTERTGSANPFDGFDIGDHSDPALVDLDGDGDLDAVVGERYGTLRYFENTGSSTAPTFAERTGNANPFDGFDIGDHSDPALVDLDGDGDLDAVAGESDGGLRFLENTGSSSSPAFVERTGSANPFNGNFNEYYSRPALVDLDGDGDFDAVVGETYGDLNYLENTGLSNAPAFVARTVSGSPFGGPEVRCKSSLDLADLDGDGDLDAVVGSYYGGLGYFEDTGLSSAPAFVGRSGSADPFLGLGAFHHTAPELVDVDGDGDLDAVVGEVYGSLDYFENTGSSSAPAFVERTGSANPFDGIDIGSSSSPKLEDLDGDGDLDAIVGESFGSLSYFENTGSSSAPAFVERTGSANPFEGIDLASNSVPELVDLDSDGDVDAVVGDLSGRLSYFENTGNSSAPAFTERTGSANPFDGIGVGGNSAPNLVDLDGDGDLDAVLGEGAITPLCSGKIIFFRSSFVDIFIDGFESGGTSAWSRTVP